MDPYCGCGPAEGHDGPCHPAQPADKWQTDIAAVAVGIVVIVAMWLLAINWPQS